MRKTFLILKNELITTIFRRSFLLTLFGFPLIIAIIMGVIGLLNRNQPGQVEQFFSPAVDTQPVGYIDPGGLIKQNTNPERVIAYTDEKTARQDLAQGKISGFYILSADYLKTGKMTSIRADFNPLTVFEQSDGFQEIVNNNLLGNDPLIIQSYDHPLKVSTVNENPEPEKAQESAFGMLVPTFVTIFFYIILMTSSSMLLSSITKEKENRMMEILMSSADAHQIVAGKIIALGLVGLLQTFVWLGSGFLLMGAGEKANMIPVGGALPVPFLIWALFYFLGGYLLYASLMAGVGAMVPNLREASQATTMVIIPLIVPMVLMSNITQAPNGTLALILSLFPFTSPVAMLARMSAGTVPTWQVALGLVLLFLGAVWVIRAVSGFFRGQVMLSGTPFSRQRFLRALIGKLD
jgi:ABC-2 type transport system permease protein